MVYQAEEEEAESCCNMYSASDKRESCDARGRLLACLLGCLLACLRDDNVFSASSILMADLLLSACLGTSRAHMARRRSRCEVGGAIDWKHQVCA